MNPERMKYDDNGLPAIGINKWQAAMDATRCGIFMLDTDYFLVVVNDYGRRMLKMIGVNNQITEATYFPDKLPAERREPVKEMLARVAAGESLEYEILYKKENGKDLWLFVTYTPITNDQGETEYICITSQNITEGKKRETSLIANEQKWKQAIDGTGDGIWQHNFITKESYYSPMYKAMLGYTDEEFDNHDTEWRKRLHPDDLPLIEKIDHDYESGTIENHSVEYRILNKSGTYSWVLDRGMVVERTADGKPVRVTGTHKDITDQRHSEEVRLLAEQRFSSFMSNTPTMSWIIDENAVFRYLNEPYMKAFRLTKEHIGQSIYNIFPEHICTAFIQNNFKVWAEGKPLEVIEEGIGPDGEQQFYQIFKFPLAPEKGMRLLGGVALDITNKIKIEKELVADKEKKKREIIQAIINAQEKERKELAYELHDNVNQVLTSSKLMLEVAAERPDLSADFIRRSLAYLNSAIVEIRKISHSLTPGTLQDISLEAAIGEVIQNINSSGRLKITYSNKTIGPKKEIQPDIQLSALRIVQEQLNNIIKHSGASEAVVILEVSEMFIRLSITDNGNGFDPGTTRRGLGLNNIFNRAEYFHGSVTIDSSPGNGCSLHIEIPVR